MNDMNRKAILFCAWFGPLSTIIFVLGGAIVGGYIPPLVSPSMPAEQIAQLFADNQIRILIGYCLIMIATGMQAPWVAAAAAYFRRTEGEFPVYTYTQLVCMGAAIAVLLVCFVPWGVAAFRPTENLPEVIQFSIDLGFFFALTTYPIFLVWCVIWALAILQDKSPVPMFPRWAAYFNLWMGLLFVPGGMIAFFKHGPFAWDGILGLYFPFVFYFVWLLGMCYCMIARIDKVDVGDGAVNRASAAGAPSAASPQPA